MTRTGLTTTLLQTQVPSNLEPFVSYPLEPMKSEITEFQAFVVDGELELASRVLLEILLVLRIIVVLRMKLSVGLKRDHL